MSRLYIIYISLKTPGRWA